MDKADELSDQLVAEYRDLAWAHYLRGLRLVETDLAGALVAFAAGNASADYSTPTCFPLGFVLDRLNSNAGVGSELVAGAIIDREYYCEPISYRQYAGAFKALDAAAVQPIKPESRQILFRFGCHLGASPNSGFTESQLGLKLIQDQAQGALGDPASRPTQDRIGVFHEILDRTDSINNGLISYKTAVYEMMRMLELPGWTRGTTRDWPYYPPSMLDNLGTHKLLHWYYTHSPNRWHLICDVRYTDLLQLRHTRSEFGEMCKVKLAEPELPAD